MRREYDGARDPRRAGQLRRTRTYDVQLAFMSKVIESLQGGEAGPARARAGAPTPPQCRRPSPPSRVPRRLRSSSRAGTGKRSPAVRAARRRAAARELRAPRAVGAAPMRAGLRIAHGGRRRRRARRRGRGRILRVAHAHAARSAVRHAGLSGVPARDRRARLARTAASPRTPHVAKLGGGAQNRACAALTKRNACRFKEPLTRRGGTDAGDHALARSPTHREGGTAAAAAAAAADAAREPCRGGARATAAGGGLLDIEDAPLAPRRSPSARLRRASRRAAAGSNRATALRAGDGLRARGAQATCSFPSFRASLRCTGRARSRSSTRRTTSRPSLARRRARTCLASRARSSRVRGAAARVARAVVGRLRATARLGTADDRGGRAAQARARAENELTARAARARARRRPSAGLRSRSRCSMRLRARGGERLSSTRHPPRRRPAARARRLGRGRAAARPSSRRRGARAPAITERRRRATQPARRRRRAPSARERPRP